MLLAKVVFAAAVTAAVLGVPGVAAAEGPGYGGNADRLIVKKKPNKHVTVYGVGFRGGSEVRLRVGSGAEETAAADANGTLLVQVDAAAGATIVAVGQTPAETTWMLVGSVPADPPVNGPADLAPYVMGGLGLIALAGSLIPGARRRAAYGSKR